MDTQTARHWHGAVELVEDGMEHGSTRIEAVHLGIAQVPYAVLKQVRPLVGPVGHIERLQHGIATTVYSAVRIVTWLAATSAKRVLTTAGRLDD